MFISDQCGIPSLYNLARHMALWHYKDVSQSESFLQASKDDILDLLKDDLLNVSSEMDVVLSVVAWLDHEPAKRTQWVCELFSGIRVRLCEQGLRDIKSHPLVGRYVEEILLQASMRSENEKVIR